MPDVLDGLPLETVATCLSVSCYLDTRTVDGRMWPSQTGSAEKARNPGRQQTECQHPRPQEEAVIGMQGGAPAKTTPTPLPTGVQVLGVPCVFPDPSWLG